MSEKTEQPTPKRIRDSREKGDIAKGQDLAPAATVLAFALYAIGNGETVWEELVQMTTVPMEVFIFPTRRRSPNPSRLSSTSRSGSSSPWWGS